MRKTAGVELALGIPAGVGQVATRSLALGLCLAVVFVLSVGYPAWAVNSVVVESKTVQVGAKDVQIGIFLTNDVNLRFLTVPVTLRSLSGGGGFIAKMAVKRTAGARLSGFLSSVTQTSGYFADPDSLHGCWQQSGTVFTYFKGFYHVRWSDTLSHVDTMVIVDADTTVYSVTQPPVAAFFVCGNFLPNDPSFPAGSDGSTPSLQLLVDVSASSGQFEIDTVCVGTYNHINFVQHPTGTPILPQFTKGVITVVCTKPLPVPIGPIPADTANDQPGSVTLKWNPVIDSCADPVTYDVLFGADCDSLNLKCSGISADSCLATDLSPNTSYFWKVVVKGTGGRQISGLCWSFKTGTGSAVQYLGGDGIPRDYSLDQNYPNPFNASTVIKFNTKHDGHVRLDVLNILGQKVKTLVDEFRHYGPQAVDWDGTDVSGQAVPTGLYFYRLVTNDFSDVKKMVLLK